MGNPIKQAKRARRLYAELAIEPLISTEELYDLRFTKVLHWELVLSTGGKAWKTLYEIDPRKAMELLELE